MSKYENGWHEIAGYTVHVEDGKVKWGIQDHSGAVVYPYHWSDNLRCWVSESMTVDAFRAGVRRETIAMM